MVFISLYELKVAADKRNARQLELRLAMSIEYIRDWVYWVDFVRSENN